MKRVLFKQIILCFFLLSTFGSYGVAASSSEALDRVMSNAEPLAPYKEVFISSDMNTKGNMETFYLNGMSLWGSQYAPYIGLFDFNFHNMAYGFYPRRASNKAKICAEFAYNEMVQSLSLGWPEMSHLIDNHDVANRILLWVNDFGYAAPSRLPVYSGFWYWDTGLKRTSTWVWGVTYTEDSRCLFPDKEYLYEQIFKVLRNRR